MKTSATGDDSHTKYQFYVDILGDTFDPLFQVRIGLYILCLLWTFESPGLDRKCTLLNKEIILFHT